ncbi:MAG TPA: hydantoinase/oxoprolinase family protein [Methylomusa anaerophila]|uniref:hydantoinase/oxoprolinase family protein n=1 Tax=Methylomusa anaerophila TaxID=1930071 RepID=UPI002B749269|nr:hydantoinase/oxoprolinase family protein [Methylomusa anaerophila]HML88273.1 hydantoinase/oxoprolinase family protein [Methylomusa anaerophila]
MRFITESEVKGEGNGMLLGIDVGGTFTDAVVVDNGKILAIAKKPTTQGNLLNGIVEAIDKVLEHIAPAHIQRVALSTTVVTNSLVEGKTEAAGLLLIPGPGMNIAGLLPVEPFILSGYIDHRGREVSRPNKREVENVVQQLKGCRTLAVAGKFAVRNPAQEQLVAGWVRETYAPEHVTMGAQVSGTLNFLRRANSAYFNATVWRIFQMFAAAITKAVADRGIKAPLYILKADGGTMPLSHAEDVPVEAIFTGPAASVLGVMAMAAPESQAVSLDIGGTTTDIALWENGVPLFAPGGARINGFPTAVRSFWLRSVGVGGDSYVRRENGQIVVGPMRFGPAMALGGAQPTVSDAMRLLELTQYGEFELAELAMQRLANPNQTAADVAREVLGIAAGLISQAIRDMLAEQAAAPVYKVEDIVYGREFQPQMVLGVGGAAGGLAPMVAAELGVPCIVPPGAMVANAIGAAIARPTTEITLRADTAQGYYTVPELGIKQEFDKGKFSLDTAWTLAAGHLRERAAASGMAEAVADMERLYEEEFNVVRGFYTVGKIITCKLQIKPGVLITVTAKESAGV